MTDENQDELDVRLNPPGFKYERHFVMVDPEKWESINAELDSERRHASTLSEHAQQLRAEIAAGGESPIEQYDLLDTITLLRTRWIPVRDHLVELRQLEAEVQRLRDDLAREKCAARLRVSRFADVQDCVKRDL